MDIKIPKSHPRYLSLLTRERIIEGMTENVVAPAGLIAHGRGEAFDYLFGESTPPFVAAAIEAAAAAILSAKKPVISVNGNVAALCPSELVELSRVTGAPLEINLFYRTEARELAILEVLKKAGAERVLGVGRAASATIPELQSERRRVDPEGILVADLVLVPLEDGDRTEALVAMGKTVLTIDLNPLSRTARMAHITIVDNVIRCLPALADRAAALKSASASDLKSIFDRFDNANNLAASLRFLGKRLESLVSEFERSGPGAKRP